MNPATTFNYPVYSYPTTWREKVFFDLTAQMLDCVRDHNFEVLSQLCDDDFGIIDINTAGGSEIIRDRAGWEAWFKGLFTQLPAMGVNTWSEITGYEAIQSGDMGYNVTDFDQHFVLGSLHLKFGVIATIIWKKDEAGSWKEARYHSSLKYIRDLEDREVDLASVMAAI